MAVELLGNLGESTLSAAITSTSATTLTVTSATPFPAAVTGTSQFRVIVDSELMIVTNVSGTTFTVTRGAEGTTAATHSSLAPITHVITAAVLAAIGVPAGAGGAGKVLTSGSADYAQAWTTPGYGGGDYFRSGYYNMGVPSGALGTATLVVNRLTVRSFIVPVRRAFDRIGINITTAATAASGGVIRMGLYAPGAGAPGSLLVDSGAISSESLGAKEFTISQTLDPGIYWVGVVAQVAACGVTALPASSPVNLPYFAEQTVPPTGSQGAGAFNSGVTVSGALPSSYAPGNSVTTPGAVALRAT